MEAIHRPYSARQPGPVAHEGDEVCRRKRSLTLRGSVLLCSPSRSSGFQPAVEPLEGVTLHFVVEQKAVAPSGHHSAVAGRSATRPGRLRSRLLRRDSRPAPNRERERASAPPVRRLHSERPPIPLPWSRGTVCFRGGPSAAGRESPLPIVRERTASNT